MSKVSTEGPAYSGDSPPSPAGVMAPGGASYASRRAWVPDPYLGLAVALLMTLGLVLVYSSSAVFADRTYGDSNRFLRAQLVWLVIGTAAMLTMARMPRRFLMGRSGWAFVIGVALCALVLVPGIGTVAGGARRWLVLGPLTCQPSELAKLAVVIMLSALFASQHGRAIWVPMLLTQVPVALIVMEPDLGSGIVIELLLAIMVFAAGLRAQTLLLSALAAMPVLYHLIVGTPFRLRRLLGYIDPWAFRSTVGYQVTEALISIGSGGVYGVGLGDGKQKLFFLPEAHTDFIFAILAEELGLIGVFVLLAAFAMVTWRGLRLARVATHAFDRFLALGATSLVAVPALFNVCVATGLLPTKGLPLPLISYGGSNLLVTLMAIGMLWRIDRDVAWERV